MDNNVGTITLSTEVDTKGVDKGLVDIERKVTAKGFMGKFSRMFNGMFSKISSGANKITSSIGKGMSSILKGLGSIFSSIGGIAGIIAKISLIGILGMILLAANYSETAKTQLQEIGTIVLNLADVLAQLILPVAEVLVNLLYEAVKWIADLLNGWFGIDLYAKRTDKSLKNGVKSAKALRKQLLGFDEMNILNKDGTIGGLGSSTSGGGTTPTPTTKRKKIIDLTTPGAKDFFTFGAKDWINLPSTKKFLKKGVKDFIKDKNNILTKGAGSSLWQWLFGKNKSGTIDDLQSILSSTNGLSKEIASKIRDTFIGASVEYKNGMVQITTTTGQAIKMTETDYKRLMQMLGTSTDETTGKITGTWTSFVQKIANKFLGKDNNSFFGGLKTAFNSIENESSKSGDNTKKNWSKTIVDLINDTKTKVDEYNKNPKTAKVKVEQDNQNNTKTTIDEVKKEVDKTNKNPFVVKLISKMDTSKMMETIRKLAKSWPVMWQPILNKLESYGFAKGGIINPPRLAKGGIINRPGSGVPIAVGGERGREAIVPLTDNQQMAYLGREIAKYISINLTNVTELDGRQIARKVTQVMNEINFASNGGVI